MTLHLSDVRRALELLAAAMLRPHAPRHSFERVAVVDVREQRLTLFERFEPRFAARVSTAAAGIGGESGSLRTPPGWHRVHARIGEGAPRRRGVREPRAHRDASGAAARETSDLILTRILTLEGLEDGVNRGPGCDSLERYIYLHGTNHEEALGQPGLARLRAARATPT